MPLTKAFVVASGSSAELRSSTSLTEPGSILSDDEMAAPANSGALAAAMATAAPVFRESVIAQSASTAPNAPESSFAPTIIISAAV